MTLNAVSGNALLSGYSESASTVRTVAVVFRHNTTVSGTQVIFGSLGTAVENNGGALFTSLVGGARKLFSTYRGITSSVDLGIVLVSGNWYFVSTAMDFSGSQKKLSHVIGSFASYQTAVAGTYIPPTAGRKLSVGNAYFEVAAAVPGDFAECLVFDGQALSVTDLQAVYASRKAKLALRGIAVV